MQVNWSKPKNIVQPQLGVDNLATPAVVLPALPLTGYQNLDPIKYQQSLADSMLAAGSSTAPAHGGMFEGLARIAEGGLGGYFKHKADERLDVAKTKNSDQLRSDVKAGDWPSLLTSNDPMAEKLGSVILEQTMKRKTGAYKKLDDGTVVWEDSDGGKPEVISRPNAGVPAGYRWKEDGTGVEYIPGGPADPVVVSKRATAGRKPDPADQTGIPPWERKW